MNIIKQIFDLPDTPSGKKRLNNLITRLGLGKKIKGDLMKDVVSGELGGDSNEEYINTIEEFVEKYPYIYPTFYVNQTFQPIYDEPRYKIIENMGFKFF